MTTPRTPAHEIRVIQATETGGTSVSLAFKLPKVLVLNANDRQHWAPRAAVTKQLRAMAAHMARGQHVDADQASLRICVGWPDNRRRDVANIAPTIKALIDGCIDGGLLPDDSDKHIVETSYTAHVAGMAGIVAIDMEFVPHG